MSPAGRYHNDVLDVHVRGQGQFVVHCPHLIAGAGHQSIHMLLRCGRFL